MELRDSLRLFRPEGAQEHADLALMLRCLDAFPDMLTRDNPICHFTASSWIVDPDRTKVLMVYHNLYNTWSWTGGHADGEGDLAAVALREAREETGLRELRLLGDGIFSVQVIAVQSHIKRGAFVSSHLHLDCCYLLEAEPTAALRCKPDENSGVRWFDLDRVEAASGEAAMLPIYRKLNERLLRYRL